MMQEKLTGHEVEGKVVECPAQDAHSDFIVETFEGDVVIVTITTLPSENGQAFDGDVKADERCRGPPNGRVADEVDLAAAKC